jgi:hypothetical protein
MTAARLSFSGRRRHRRPSVSGRGARRRADQGAAFACGSHRFPRAALQRAVPKDMIDVVPSETVRGRNRRWSLARTGCMLGRHRGALNLVRRLKAGGRGRLRRLSDAAAADGGAAARRARHHPRANAVLGRANRFLSGRVARSRPRCPACSIAIRRWGKTTPSARRCVRRSSPPRDAVTRRPNRRRPLRCSWSAAARARG